MGAIVGPPRMAKVYRLPADWAEPFHCPTCGASMQLSEVKVNENEAQPEPIGPAEADFKELCFRAREYLLHAEPMLQELRKLALAYGMAVDVTGDMVANIVLAYRHLEDCRMRLGKAVQAFDGGTSVYPR